ncbi:MAG: RNA ligase family protein [Methanoregula sp.]|nr:RNA ligase family protein [Methanoregula sp.]
MVAPGQARIVCEKTRDKHDHVIVQVKVDGSNVCVANVGGEIVPLIRAGYRAISSKYRQHHLFADWVYSQLGRFSFLEPGERLCGEWLAQAHGTRYVLPHEPFVVFDLMTMPHSRLTLDQLRNRVSDKFVMPRLLSEGPPRSIEWCREAISHIRPHGELDPLEGVVWRCERDDKVDFLCKWVRPDKEDGKYLPEKHGSEVWNWLPSLR